MILNIVIYGLIVLTFLISFALTPVAIKIAKKYGIVDIPKDKRKIHKEPMPRMGGVAIVISVFIGLTIYYLVTKDISSIAVDERFTGYLIGAFIISAMGLFDDIFNLRARYKFIFQLIAGTVLYYYGIRIVGIKIPFIYPEIIDFGFLSYPITMLWIIGVTNALNLIDGLDGLAAGISTISAIALLVIFITTSASLEAIVIAAVLAGATAGFLPYNFNPAKTFMGDVSSNFLGFTLAAISILGFAKGYTLLAIVAPILILGVPIFDTVFAMIRRLLAHKPMLQPDSGHVHHRLLKKGYSQKRAVLFLYSVTSILSILAVTIISIDLVKFIILMIAIVIFVIIGIINKKELKKENEGKTNG